MKVYVTGLESSGQKWFRSCLDQHPDITATGDSTPRGWARYAGHRGYDGFCMTAEALVVIVRDRHCHRESVRRLGYNEGADPGAFTEEESKAHIRSLVQLAGSLELPVVFVSYEGLMEFGQTIFDWVFDQLGVSRMEINTEYRDGNEKYFSK